MVLGNLIGTDIHGTAKIGNFDGVFLGAGAAANTVGGTASGAANVISGNKVGVVFNNAKNMTDLRWQLLLGATVITKATWEKIPADLRPALLEITRDAGRRLQQEIKDSEAKDIEAMRKRGLNVVTLTARQRAEWQRLTETLYPKIRGPIVPPDAFDEALRFRDEYRKQRAGAGGL